MKRIFSILALLLLPLMLFVKTASAMPPNSHAVGQGWKCDTGYKRQGQQCNKAPSISAAKQPTARQNQPTSASVDKDSLESLKIRHPLAFQGNAAAESYLESLKILHPLAFPGDATAQLYIGLSYDDGGDEVDYKKAVHWFKKSAAQGNVTAQYNLGFKYAFGKGVLKDYSKAIYWFRKAATKNHRASQHMLGLYYCYGRGVEKNLRRCAVWSRKLMKMGNLVLQRHGKSLSYGSTNNDSSKSLMILYLIHATIE